MLNSQSFIINCTKLFYDMKGYLCYTFFETQYLTINWYGIIASFLYVCFVSFNLDFLLKKFLFNMEKLKPLWNYIHIVYVSVYIDVCVYVYIILFHS